MWSLDGKTELTETDKCTVEVRKDPEPTKVPEKPAPTRVTECGEPSKPPVVPYRDACNNNDTTSYDPPCKRKKIEDKIDPHDHCPISIPVGVDFMGKCPYLDEQGHSKCPFNAEILNSSGEYSGHAKCPYLKGKPAEKAVLRTGRETKLYVGIVPSKRTPLWALEQAEHLGINLAERLQQKGALEVMKAAQAVIRGAADK